MFGLLNLNKPAGVTSRRVVDQVQRLVKPAKVGHAGTLDPLASGVLVIGVGQATRLVEYVQQMPKRYRARFLLGCTSDTEDVEGEVLHLADPPQPTVAQLQQAAAGLIGQIAQRPPAYSALKVAGRRAYKLARAGREVELAPRPVRIDRLVILAYEYPELDVEIVCGSGTYVRSLGRDLAERLGTGAVMAALERTAIGHFTIESAVDPAALTRENLPQFLLPADAAVRDLMPMVTVTDDEVRRLANGQTIACADQPAESCAAVDASGRLVAILVRRDDGTFRPGKYFPAERSS
ncbi:MAG: tRNA pseudouridine(55) synthase TruB [Pirellulales bacterium]